MGQVLQFVGKADRLPKAAQIFAAWCVGADTGQFCVVAGHLAMEVAAISRLQETGSGNRFSGHLPFPFLPTASQVALALLLKAGIKPATAMMASALHEK